MSFGSYRVLPCFFYLNGGPGCSVRGAGGNHSVSALQRVFRHSERRALVPAGKKNALQLAIALTHPLKLDLSRCHHPTHNDIALDLFTSTPGSGSFSKSAPNR